MDQRERVWQEHFNANVCERLYAARAAKAHERHKHLSFLATILSSGGFATILGECNHAFSIFVVGLSTLVTGWQAFYASKDDALELSSIAADYCELTHLSQRAWDDVIAEKVVPPALLREIADRRLEIEKRSVRFAVNPKESTAAQDLTAATLA